jgi:lipid II:glycine glycyltransferase (peptidoglycan interpeptide bridge formation enzyme)
LIPLSPSLNIMSFLSPKKVYWDSKLGEHQFYLSRSSWSILSICMFRLKKLNQKNINVFLPNYFCNDPIPLLNQKNINLIYYEIDDQFEPDLQNLNNLSKIAKPDIFLGVHYFGNPLVSNFLKNFCIKNKCWYLEDATHCLKRDKIIGAQGDFVIFSPYKHLAIPNGAILIVRSDGPSKLNVEDYSNLNINQFLKVELKKFKLKKGLIKKDFFLSIKWVIKKIILLVLNEINLFSNYYKDIYKKGLNPNYFEIIYPYKISFISKHLMLRYDLDKISSLRIRNQNMFKEVLENKVKIHKKFNSKQNYFNHSPYLLPIILKSDDEAFELINTGIPIIRWPLYPKEALNTSKKFKNIYFILLNHTINNKYFKDIFNYQSDLKKIKILKSTSQECVEFEKLNSSNINLTQSPYYGLSKAQVENKKIDFYTILIDNRKVGVFQILQKKYFNFITLLRINRGPILINEVELNERIDIILKILKFGNIFKLRVLSITPDTSFFSIESLFLRRVRSRRLKFSNWKSSIIDLNKSLEELTFNLKPKWRNSLRKAQKQSLIINRSSDKEDVEVLLQYYLKDKKKKNFKGVNPELIKKMAQLQSDSEKLYVFNAKKDNLEVGSILISRQFKNLIYLIGWSSENGRKLNVNNLLLWEAISYFKSKECKVFDLGGLIGDNHPIDFFKLGMNGDYYENSGEYLVI